MPNGGSVANVESARSWLSADAALKFGVGLLTGGLLLYGAIKLLSTGDEPPIRVKKGSIEMELLAKAGGVTWTENGNKKNWKLSGGTRANDGYDVFVAADSTKCSNGGYARGVNWVEITYDDNYSVRVQSTGKHTKVMSKAPNGSGNPPPDLKGDTARLLKYDKTGGFIKWIDVQGVAGHFCEFRNDTELKAMVLLDY